MTIFRVATASVVVLSGLLAAPAFAAIEPFPLFSTGAGTSQGSVDAHYTLVSSPSASTTAYHTVPHYKWGANPSPTVGWISDRANSGSGFHDVGKYTYQQEFSLAGYNSAATIDMDFLVDNRVEISLNGNAVADGDRLGTHSTLSNVVLDDDSWFNFGGLNTLTFTVTNYFGPVEHPTGLWVRVNSATANTTPIGGPVIPEPGTFAMWGVGALVGLLFARRRLRQTASI